jgi:hypothetical protein
MADDFKTINGKEYKNATISHVEADGIVLRTQSGISKSAYDQLAQGWIGTAWIIREMSSKDANREVVDMVWHSKILPNHSAESRNHLPAQSPVPAFCDDPTRTRQARFEKVTGLPCAWLNWGRL